MTTDLNLIKDTFINHHTLKKDIIVHWWAGYSINEIARKLNLDQEFIQDTLIARNKELGIYFKEVQ